MPAPEIFYVAFPLPVGEALPRLSSGGQPFTPFTDQLPGTCRDYFAFDGWADYTTPEGRWLWVSRDAPLMTFGDSPTLALRQSPPKDVASPAGHGLQQLLVHQLRRGRARDHGVPVRPHLAANNEGSPQDLAEALVTEPVMLINPAMPEDARVVENLYRP